MIVKCGICGGACDFKDERIEDFILEELSGRNCCSNCFLKMEAEKALIQDAALSGQTPKEYIADWMDVYGQ